MALGDRLFTAIRQLGNRWWVRHLAVLAVGLAGVYLFQESRAKWSEMHRWNRAFGDMSLVLVCLAMAVGPLARLWSRFSFLIPWRRELGIYGVLLAAVHTAFILVGWIEWDLMRLFGFEVHPGTGQYVMVQHGFALANIVGLVALLYAVVLAGSSNDASQRFFGGSAWKFLQQGAYVLWVLVLLHTAYFLYIHFLHFHVAVPKPNWAQWPFVWLVLATAVLQAAAFLKTWRARQRKRGGGDFGAKRVRV